MFVSACLLKHIKRLDLLIYNVRMVNSTVGQVLDYLFCVDEKGTNTSDILTLRPIKLFQLGYPISPSVQKIPLTA